MCFAGAPDGEGRRTGDVCGGPGPVGAPIISQFFVLKKPNNGFTEESLSQSPTRRQVTKRFFAQSWTYLHGRAKWKW